MKTQTVCILLAIVIIGIFGYAAMNGGKLWGNEQENFQQFIPLNTPSCGPGLPPCTGGKTCKNYGMFGGLPRCL